MGKLKNNQNKMQKVNKETLALLMASAIFATSFVASAHKFNENDIKAKEIVSDFSSTPAYDELVAYEISKTHSDFQDQKISQDEYMETLSEYIRKPNKDLFYKYAPKEDIEQYEELNQENGPLLLQLSTSLVGSMATAVAGAYMHQKGKENDLER